MKYTTSASAGRTTSSSIRTSRSLVPTSGPSVHLQRDRYIWQTLSLGVESGGQTESREDLGILEHRSPADALGCDGEDLERVQLVSATDAPISGKPGLAIGRDRLQTPVRSGVPENPLNEQAVVAGAREPVEHRRHLHEHVLGEQLHETFDVGVLERLHVAIDPGALLGC